MKLEKRSVLWSFRTACTYSSLNEKSSVWQNLYFHCHFSWLLPCGMSTCKIVKPILIGTVPARIPIAAAPAPPMPSVEASAPPEPPAYFDGMSLRHHTSRMTVVTPTDCPKSVCNRCVNEVFGGIIVLSICFRIFCWYRGFCHSTESDLLFLFIYKFLNVCPFDLHNFCS